MDKILELLSKMLPENEVKEFSGVVSEMLEEAKANIKAELEAEYNQNLEEAYAQLSEEVKTAEKTAVEGYHEAWDIIVDLYNRIEAVKNEYKQAMDEGYEEAYQIYLAEKGKNENLELELHNEYEKRFQESNEFIVDKVDLFLRTKGKEIYEMARRDVMSDPSMVEHKLVLDKIVESVSNYVSDEDRMMATSGTVDQLKKNLKEAEDRIIRLESKNIRISVENTKLQEQVKQASELLTESKNTVLEENKKARVEAAKNATGRGFVTDKIKVISEETETEPKGDKNTMVESFGKDMMQNLKEMQILAGTKVNE